MQQRTWVWAGWVCTGAVLAAGCGKPVLPGTQFRGQRATVPGLVATDTPLPAKPFQEWGPQNAKVHVLVFFPIDDPHKQLLDLVKGLAEKYPGKLYAKYVDYRTAEGAQMFKQTKRTVACIMIDGETSVALPSKYGPRTVDFFGPMGRSWTEDDLREAIANAVAKAYGKQKQPSRSAEGLPAYQSADCCAVVQTRFLPVRLAS